MFRGNPFNPGSPVNPGMFVGRVRELERLEAGLIQAKFGNPNHFMLTGERGIGKTSLLLYLRFIARGELDIHGQRLKFLTINTQVEAQTNQISLIRRIEWDLRKELGKAESVRSFLADTWEFLKRVRIADSGIDDAPKITDPDLLLDEFTYSLAKTTNRVCQSDGKEGEFPKYDGVLLLIDEADNSAPDLQLGAFAKVLTERLQYEDCGNVLVVLAGLPELSSVLRDSHPSSLRIFEEIVLERLSDDEVDEVIDRCLARAAEDNGKEVTIDTEARGYLRMFSEGYPHFIQQFGHSAFAADDDSIISSDDFKKGAFGRGGALELIGDRYYRDNFYRRIQKDSYRQVLRIMADKLDDWVTKSEIRAGFRGKASILDNALRALRDRHIILAKESERGVYRLQHKAFALWIKFYANNSDSISDSVGTDAK